MAILARITDTLQKPENLRILRKGAEFFYSIITIVARIFLRLKCLYLYGLPQKQPPIKDLLLMHSASELAAKIRKRQVTSEEVVKCFIERAKLVQPILNCIVDDQFEEALKEAKKCDEFLASPEAPTVDVLAKEKPFFGVPFTTKDCIAIEGMKLTCGLVVRKDKRATKDAEPIHLMRQAGGIPIAITNVPELAMWWETSNCLFGTTRNPHNTWCIVGGSSGGEGSLLAAAGSACGVGSDIGGSIRLPAFFCGIFGHKPSMKIVSLEGHYPNLMSEKERELCVIGPMSRFAQDLRPMLQVLAGQNADLLNLQSPAVTSEIKIYYMEGQETFGVTPLEPEIRDALKRSVKHLETVYGVTATKLQLSAFDKSLEVWWAFLKHNETVETDMCSQLTDQNGRVDIRFEFIKWILGRSNHTLYSLLTASNAINLVTPQMYQKSENPEEELIREGYELRRKFEEILGNNGIFLYPTQPATPLFHDETLIKPLNFAYTIPFNVLGLPVTACPLGFNKQGLPIGIQVVAGLHQDNLCITVAEELERAFPMSNRNILKN